MDKYIGNKKNILNGIEEFLKSKGVEAGVLIDAFSGTTNVGQVFKQRGFSVVSNDVNDFSYILGKVYIENNTFPRFSAILEQIEGGGFHFDTNEIERWKTYIKKKVQGEKTFADTYYDDVDFENGIMPLLKVLQYLNQLPVGDLSEEERLFFDYYTVTGGKSTYKSARGTEGKRNYFTADNAKKVGKILAVIKQWKLSEFVNENEFYVLLCCLIEEVTLNANVNGTFHDFNRNKLYPNAEAPLVLKPIMLNIYGGGGREYLICKEDANELYKDEKLTRLFQGQEDTVLYIDPPYNFRQYSAYYHMLNFIARYHEMEDVLAYAKGFKYVRGQNMQDNFNSKYCYKDEFIPAMKDLIANIKSKHVLISYYDENNHWNHGKETVSYEGREELLGIFAENNEFAAYDERPYIIPRVNYQSRSGEHKKQIEELLFYARR